MAMSSSKQARHSISVPGEPPLQEKRRRCSFLRLHLPETNLRGSLSHLHLPTFTITTPDGEPSTNNKGFIFGGLGLRRFSNNVS